MKKKLLKKLNSVFIMIVIYFFSSIPVLAEEKSVSINGSGATSDILLLYEKLYKGESQVSLQRKGKDVTEEFINGTKNIYIGGDTKFISYLLSVDSIDIIEEYEIVPYSITSKSITKVLENQIITGTSALTGKPVSDKCFIYFTFTIVWDQTTEKISGNPRTPSVVADPNEGGNYDSLVVTNVQDNGKITNGGFSVQYTQINVSLKGTNSLDDWSVNQYYTYNWSGNYTFTPANGLN